jgi:hypothetical protein
LSAENHSPSKEIALSNSVFAAEILLMQDSIPTRRIHEPFVVAALGFALTAGFGYAALLVAALAL